MGLGAVGCGRLPFFKKIKDKKPYRRGCPVCSRSHRVKYLNFYKPLKHENMIYLWLYLILGALFTVWLVYWSVKHEGETLYIRDIWKIVLGYAAWPFMGACWIWLILDDRYNIGNRIEQLGGKKLF